MIHQNLADIIAYITIVQDHFEFSTLDGPFGSHDPNQKQEPEKIWVSLFLSALIQGSALGGFHKPRRQVLGLFFPPPPSPPT